MGFKINGREIIPRIIKKTATDHGYVFLLSLPPGLCTEDFIKKKQPIAEALIGDVDFHYADGKIVMTVMSKNAKP